MAHAPIIGTLCQADHWRVRSACGTDADLATAQNSARPGSRVRSWLGRICRRRGCQREPGRRRVRLYLAPVSVGPELVYIHGDNHSHLMVTGNVTWDLLAPTNGRPPAITPFLVVGGGCFQTRETFFSGSFTSREGAFTAGGGVRSVVGDRVTIGADARIGWELHLRVNGLVGTTAGAVTSAASRARRVVYPEADERRRTGVVSSRSSSRSMDCRSTSRPFKIRFATCSRSFNSGSVTEYRVAAPLFFATTIPLARRRANCCDTIG